MNNEIIEYIRINAEQQWAKCIKNMYLDNNDYSTEKIKMYYEFYEKYEEIDLSIDLIDNIVLVKFPLLPTLMTVGEEVIYQKILEDYTVYLNDIQEEIQTITDNHFFKKNLSFTNIYNRGNIHDNFKLGMYRRDNL